MPLENEDQFDQPSVHLQGKLEGVDVSRYLFNPDQGRVNPLEQRKPPAFPGFLFAPLLATTGGYIVERRNGAAPELQVKDMLSTYGDRLPKSGVIYLVNSDMKIITTFQYKPAQSWEINPIHTPRGVALP